jgi:hypothetical protein
MARKSAISRYLAKIGSKGGKVTGTKKGFAALTDEERQAVARKAAAGRRAAAAKRKKSAK